MSMSATNQNQLNQNLYKNLNAEEKILLDECMSRIMRHVDKNLEKAAELKTVARLLTFRWLLSGMTQKTEN